MLKGIKKIGGEGEKIEVEVGTIRSTVDSHRLKEEALVEEEAGEGQGMALQSSEQADLKMYQECYDLFLQGKSEQLTERL
jgi:hypothetical protein